MRIPELTTVLQREGWLTAHMYSSIKTFITKEKACAYTQWKNMPDVFGICQTDDGQYWLFITDSERGISIYSDVYETEEEACDALLKKVSLEEQVYKIRLTRCRQGEQRIADAKKGYRVHTKDKGKDPECGRARS